MVTHKRAQSAAVFRAIADPTRREILGLLRRGPHTVGAIAANFRTSRPAISKHLRLLRSVGLVATRQDGTARVCELNARPLRAVREWLGGHEGVWGGRLRSLKRYVGEDGGWNGRRPACPSSGEYASKSRRRGGTRTSGLATDSEVAAGIRGGPSPGSRECITLKGTRPEDRRKTSYPSPADLRNAAQRGSLIRFRLP